MSFADVCISFVFWLLWLDRAAPGLRSRDRDMEEKIRGIKDGGALRKLVIFRSLSQQKNMGFRTRVSNSGWRGKGETVNSEQPRGQYSVASCDGEFAKFHGKRELGKAPCCRWGPPATYSLIFTLHCKARRIAHHASQKNLTRLTVCTAHAILL